MRNSKELLDYSSLIKKALKKYQEKKNSKPLLLIDILYSGLHGIIYLSKLVKIRKSLIRVRILRLKHENEILKNFIQKK